MIRFMRKSKPKSSTNKWQNVPKCYDVTFLPLVSLKWWC